MYDDKELETVVTIFAMMLKDNISLKDIDMNIVGKYLNEDQILLFLYMEEKWLGMNANEYEANKQKFLKDKSENIKIEWEEADPYKVLEIEKREYTKEELLNRLEAQMILKSLIKDKKERQKQIDQVLDAYNEIIKIKKLK